MVSSGTYPPKLEILMSDRIAWSTFTHDDDDQSLWDVMIFKLDIKSETKLNPSSNRSQPFSISSLTQDLNEVIGFKSILRVLYKQCVPLTGWELTIIVWCSWKALKPIIKKVHYFNFTSPHSPLLNRYDERDPDLKTDDDFWPTDLNSKNSMFWNDDKLDDLHSSKSFRQSKRSWSQRPSQLVMLEVNRWLKWF